MRLKKFIRTHILFIILLIFLTGYLGLKAMPEESWDDWGFGSAQTMMSSKHWVEDGFIYSKFLFLPTGYSKTVRYLDDPDLRQHAHGIRTGELIGNRLYYTHYPAGYLVPHALLMKIGFSERFWFRWLAIIFSLIGLGLMYALFCLISTRAVAFLAALYYAGSTMFLGLADSLANQPVDDLFRFLILFLSILAYRISDIKKQKVFNALIWISYFILASSSYDSTFFVFVWLVGLDIIMMRKFLWKKWLIFASAPVAAFVLQMFQNVWYLGLHDALLDVYGSFRARANTGPGVGILERHIRAIFSPLSYMTDLRARFAIPIVATVFASFWYFKNKIYYQWPKIKILILLALSAAAYPFVLVSSGYFPYQGRQMAPFVSLLVASATVLVFLALKKFINTKEKIKFAGIAVFIVFLFLTGFLWFNQGARTYSYIKEWPNNVVDEKTIQTGKELRELADGKDAMVFRLVPKSVYQYPQADPFLEYYAGMPILSFRNLRDLENDLKLLKERSEFPFLEIIINNE